jgi:MFS family permease
MEQRPPGVGENFRTFLIVWSTQSISVLGSAITFFAITIWLSQVLYARAEDRPALGFALAAVALASALPAVFAAPLAGAWVDRHDRKRTMLAMDFANGCLSCLLVALLLANMLQLWVVLCVVMLSSLVSTLHSSALDASYVMLVPEDRLPRANGMMQTTFSLSGVLSPAIAATLITLPILARQGVMFGGPDSPLSALADGTPLVVAIDGLTFFVAAIALLVVVVPSPEPGEASADAEAPGSFRADVFFGARYIWRHRPMLWLLLTFTVANLLCSPVTVIEPLVLKFNLAPSWSAQGLSFEAALALLTSVASLGGVAGGVAISVWGGMKERRVYGVVVALIVAGVAQVVFGLGGIFFLAVGTAFVVEATIPIMNAHSQAIWQAQTPPNQQGRVFAMRRLIAQATYPLGTLLAGLAAGVLDPGLVFALAGALLAVFCASQLLNSALMRVESQPAAESRARLRTVTTTES